MGRCVHRAGHSATASIIHGAVERQPGGTERQPGGTPRSARGVQRECTRRTSRERAVAGPERAAAGTERAVAGTTTGDRGPTGAPARGGRRADGGAGAGGPKQRIGASYRFRRGERDAGCARPVSPTGTAGSSAERRDAPSRDTRTGGEAILRAPIGSSCYGAGGDVFGHGLRHLCGGRRRRTDGDEASDGKKAFQLILDYETEMVRKLVMILFLSLTNSVNNPKLNSNIYVRLEIVLFFTPFWEWIQMLFGNDYP